MKKENSSHEEGFFHHIELSAVITAVGIILLFSTAIIVTLVSPRFIDPAWTEPSSYFQVQMYEIADPNLYVGRAALSSPTLQFIYHLKQETSLLAFTETETIRIVAPPDLEPFITRYQDPELKLTSQLLLLRKPDPLEKTTQFNAFEASEALQKQIFEKQSETNPQDSRIAYEIFELYRPSGKEAFAIAETDGVTENFIDSHFVILDDSPKHPYHQDAGVIYVKNPQEFRVRKTKFDQQEQWAYDPKGKPLKNVAELQGKPYQFLSRKQLIYMGEDIFAKEGCFYCHTDQTRTLVQDVVLNGSESFPAPPSSPNEYIYQNVTFPGTRRIGPDLSRVSIKRPGRDWHKSHFWAPKTASPGSIMPSFRHFFDDDPRGSSSNPTGVPNYKFEAIFQYLMTKGNRITPPTQAWWLGKDPVRALEIIEGRK